MATTEHTINDALAGVLMETRSLWRYKGGASKNEMLEDWKRILRVNYWPIFDIARRILSQRSP